jgi:hypothetical protein
METRPTGKGKSPAIAGLFGCIVLWHRINVG